MSDLKAIKHKTFCKTQMPYSAFPGNYDNNSGVVGVARSLWRWGRGARGDGSKFTKVL